jgi:subtilase family serine protease
MQSVPVAIPGDVTPGDYYIGAIADSGQAIAESDETNYVRRSPRVFKVLRPLSADLQFDPNPASDPG